jgi:chorismate mutase
MQTLSQLRTQINQVDSDIIEKLAIRQRLSREIGEIKLSQGMEIIDPLREKELYALYEKLSCEYKLESGFVKMLFKLIIDYCRKVQK